MYKHMDYCTHINIPEDVDILTRKLFNVNMRLYKTSKQYRDIVLECAKYILWNAQTEKEGYKKPHGFSGANAGIPFNIIATRNEVMLNPEIVKSSGERTGMSNCGSLTLKEPLQISRKAHIVVHYFDLNGAPKRVDGHLPTVQHEIDHNNGILITDRRMK